MHSLILFKKHFLKILTFRNTAQISSCCLTFNHTENIKIYKFLLYSFNNLGSAESCLQKSFLLSFFGFDFSSNLRTKILLIYFFLQFDGKSGESFEEIAFDIFGALRVSTAKKRMICLFDYFLGRSGVLVFKEIISKKKSWNFDEKSHLKNEIFEMHFQKKKKEFSENQRFQL